MTRPEILRKLREAKEALDDYNQQGFSAAKSVQEIDENRQIKDEFQQLARKSYAINPAGAPCPSCGGSGRI